MLGTKVCKKITSVSYFNVFLMIFNKNKKKNEAEYIV